MQFCMRTSLFNFFLFLIIYALVACIHFSFLPLTINNSANYTMWSYQQITLLSNLKWKQITFLLAANLEISEGDQNHPFMITSIFKNYEVNVKSILRGPERFVFQIIVVQVNNSLIIIMQHQEPMQVSRLINKQSIDIDLLEEFVVMFFEQRGNQKWKQLLGKAIGVKKENIQDFQQQIAVKKRIRQICSNGFPEEMAAALVYSNTGYLKDTNIQWLGFQKYFKATTCYHDWKTAVIQQMGQEKYAIVFYKSLRRYKAGTPNLHLFGDFTKQEALDKLTKFGVSTKILSHIKQAEDWTYISKSYQIWFKLQPQIILTKQELISYLERL